jgi:ribosomal protein L37E
VTPHDHRTLVEGCYRCELGRDEARAAEQEDEAMRAVNQDRPPNFRADDGRLYLVRCFACGRENYALAVRGGECAWCGWYEDVPASTRNQEDR